MTSEEDPIGLPGPRVPGLTLGTWLAVQVVGGLAAQIRQGTVTPPPPGGGTVPAGGLLSPQTPNVP